MKNLQLGIEFFNCFLESFFKWFLKIRIFNNNTKKLVFTSRAVEVFLILSVTCSVLRKYEVILPTIDVHVVEVRSIKQKHLQQAAKLLRRKEKFCIQIKLTYC